MYILSGDIGGTNTRLEVSLLENGGDTKYSYKKV